MPATRTTNAMAEAGRVSVYDLQIFLAQSGYDPGRIDGIMGGITMRALQSWIADYFEEHPTLSITTRPSADKTELHVDPPSLAKVIIEIARQRHPMGTPSPFIRSEESLAAEGPGGAVTTPAPSKPFFRLNNPWLWVGAAALAGGGYYAWREGWIPGLSGTGDALAATSAAPSGELSTTLGYTAGLLGAGIGLAAWSYGKWGNRLQGGLPQDHLQQAKINGAIILALSLAITGGVYFYDRSL